ncbi:cyclophilin-like fold protein [Streptomyces scopuliridis]|uniref:cyclophilin-like fold protein n=1 Tax=Streptomyces scopuliridis TaxID=452529 RepID=UPI000B207AD9|nr:cyclophilin-like fold protein [Streptomyces scopuliridis]
MKKALASVTGAATAVALAACSSNTVADSTGSPSATTEVSSPGSRSSAGADASVNEGTPITFTVGDRTIRARLNNSDAARDFEEMLPVTLPWFRNLDIEYISELSDPLTETGPFYTDVQPGDIVYYNPRDSVTIIYEPTSSVPTLTKMGEITSDVSVFEDLPANVDMRIEAG